jgi:hypothetical protein
MPRESKPRYIELTYNLPDEEQERWRGVVVHTDSPKTAFEEARADTMRAHPEATNVQEYMHRVLSDEKAADITGQMADGTWSGWRVKEGSA